MKIKKIEKLYLNGVDYEKWDAFWQLTQKIIETSEDDGELNKMVSNIQEIMNDIECDFLEEE